MRQTTRLHVPRGGSVGGLWGATTQAQQVLAGYRCGVNIDFHASERSSLGIEMELEIIDRAYIMHDGQVLMEGTPREVVANEDVRRVYLGERFSL